MKIIDAANILNLAGDITPSDIKKAYRKAAAKYHPDRNPAGAEMMKAVNEAYESLKDFSGTLGAAEGEEFEPSQYGDELNSALNAIVNLEGLDIEVCGSWVWVTGETKQHKEKLKEAGYRWASKKKAWHFRPSDWKKVSRGEMGMDDIRGMHGSTKVKTFGKKKLTGKAA
ncbi:MAG: DnaJ domain-containing protein [Pseudomonadales bacterium]|nr:DnaJ domain-containing protein [Pseudomonadales bacterium]